MISSLPSWAVAESPDLVAAEVDCEQDGVLQNRPRGESLHATQQGCSLPKSVTPQPPLPQMHRIVSEKMPIHMHSLPHQPHRVYILSQEHSMLPRDLHRIFFAGRHHSPAPSPDVVYRSLPHYVRSVPASQPHVSIKNFPSSQEKRAARDVSRRPQTLGSLLPELRRHIPTYIMTAWHQQGDSHQRQEQESVEAVQLCRKVSYIAPSEGIPILEPPRTGLFALYYILTKIGIISDAMTHWEAKQDIQSTQEEIDKRHRERIAQMQKTLAKEAQAQRWGLSIKVFAWLGALMGLIAGITMVISGVAAVSGALLVAGGVIMLTNQVLEVTGGWNKIAEALPGDDPVRKRAVITWMQIGLTVLCLILTGAGAIFGGYATVSEAMGQFMAVFGGVIMLGQGVSTVSQGIVLYQHKESIAETKRHSRHLVMLKHRREDLMHKVDDGIERIKQLFEEMVKVLDFESELFQAAQPR